MSTNLNADNLFSVNNSPRKKLTTDKLDQSLFSGEINFDFGANSIFGKQLMTVGKSGFGTAHDSSMFNDYQWDNNV